jgi:hypothetical protein
MKSFPLSILWFIIALLYSGHAFKTIFTDLTRSIYITALAALIYLVYVLAFKTIRFKAEDFLFIVSFYMVASAYLMDEFRAGAFYRATLSVILFAYFITKLYSFRQVLKLYMVVMTITSVVALVGYYLVNYTDVLSVLPIVKNVNEAEFAIGGIFNYIITIPDRNCGMFWEPGLFATHLIIAMVIELISKKRASILRLLLFSACLFTANSSAGFVLWFLCVILFFVRKNKKGAGKYFRNFFALGIVVVAVVVLLNLDYIIMNTGLKDNEYFQKLLWDNVLDSSRANAILHNLESFISSPITGVGYIQSMENMRYVADTSTSTYLMSVFGFLGAFYTLFIIFGVFRLKKVNILSKLLILAIALIIVNKEPHLQNVFTWILIFYLVRGQSKEVPSERKVRKKLE